MMNSQAVQSTELSQLTIEEVEEFYWEAIQAVGWPTGKREPKPHPRKTGYKYIRYKSDSFTFEDSWSYPHTGGNSAGEIIIRFREGVRRAYVVWVMNYGGKYPKEVIPFLKLALCQTIDSKKFVGGRGPEYFNDKGFPDFIYKNEIRSMSFSNFSGTEIIVDPENLFGKTLGYHWYRGMSLI